METKQAFALGAFVIYYINFNGENREIHSVRKEADKRFDELTNRGDVSFIEMTQTTCQRRYSKPLDA